MHRWLLSFFGFVCLFVLLVCPASRNDEILAAMAMLSERTCVSFHPRTTERDYLLFKHSRGCERVTVKGPACEYFTAASRWLLLLLFHFIFVLISFLVVLPALVVLLVLRHLLLFLVVHALVFLVLRQRNSSHAGAPRIWAASAGGSRCSWPPAAEWATSCTR